MSVYFGSSAIITSTANQEIIQQHRPTGKNYISACKFDFYNYDACSVIINGGSAIYIPAEKGFTIQEGYPEINSFVIVDADKRFTYLGLY